MTPLILIALFIERAVEVFLTPLRAPQAAAIVGKAKAIREQSKSSDLAVELGAAEAEVTAYKSQTQRIAFLTTFLLGVVVSGLGVRAIGMFLDPAAFGALSLTHRQLLVVCDVVVTGALLGGGADALHKLVSVFTDWMDRSRPAKRRKDAGKQQEESNIMSDPKRNELISELENDREEYFSAGRVNNILDITLTSLCILASIAATVLTNLGTEKARLWIASLAAIPAATTAFQRLVGIRDRSNWYFSYAARVQALATKLRYADNPNLTEFANKRADLEVEMETAWKTIGYGGVTPGQRRR